jgi:hypothetical protein
MYSSKRLFDAGYTYMAQLAEYKGQHLLISHCPKYTYATSSISDHTLLSDHMLLSADHHMSSRINYALAAVPYITVIPSDHVQLDALDPP